MLRVIRRPESSGQHQVVARGLALGTQRFDEVSAVYALFGTFYVGLRVRAAELGGIFGLPA